MVLNLTLQLLTLEPLRVQGVLSNAGPLLGSDSSLPLRIRWDEGGKKDVVLVGHRLFLAGTAALALGMFGAVFVVADFLFGLVSAIVVVVTLLALVTVTWYVLPFERGRDPRLRHTE